MESLPRLDAQAKGESSSTPPIGRLAKNQWQGHSVIIYCPKSYLEKAGEDQSNPLEIAKALTSKGARVSIILYNCSKPDDYSLCKTYSGKRMTFKEGLSYGEIHKTIDKMKENTIHIHIDADPKEVKKQESNMQADAIEPLNGQILEKSSFARIYLR